MKEIYEQIKQTNKEEVALIKSGAFYITFNEDAMIMNYIFNYTISNSKIGFPLNGLDKVKKVLKEKNINYIIYNNEIIDSNKTSNNEYINIVNLYKKKEYNSKSKEILISRIKYLIENKENYNKIRSFIDEL